MNTFRRNICSWRHILNTNIQQYFYALINTICKNLGNNRYSVMWYFVFSQQCYCRFKSFKLLQHADWQTMTDISKDCSARMLLGCYVVRTVEQLPVSKYCTTCSSWITYAEDEDTMIFQKRGNYVPVNTASHPIRPEHLIPCSFLSIPC
jgi:hypothetical protein